MIDTGGAFWVVIIAIGAIIFALALLYASQKAKHAPKASVTAQRKREATEENFSEGAIVKAPLFAESAEEATKDPETGEQAAPVNAVKAKKATKPARKKATSTAKTARRVSADKNGSPRRGSQTSQVTH